MEIISTSEDFHLALLLGKLKQQLKRDGLDILVKINIVIVTAALCEAMINRFISYQASSNTKFNELEKVNLLKKWIEVPKEFDKNYNLSENQIEMLNILISWRKNLLHPKPTITKNKKPFLSGNQPKDALTADLIGEFINLPLSLGNELLKINGSASFFKGDYFDYKRAIEDVDK